MKQVKRKIILLPFGNIIVLFSTNIMISYPKFYAVVLDTCCHHTYITEKKEKI